MVLAIKAFGEAHYAECVRKLRAVRGIAQRFGGSHAQRDIVSLTLVEAALRGGQARLARALAAERTDVKPSSPFNWRLTGRALMALGDRHGAIKARFTADAMRHLRMDPRFSLDAAAA
jgi:hypothetical protein